jgi:catechol 2,3-dioxygenase-like lactoylglutathione lyase family enzyme
VEWKLELVILPVSDVDRAKEFYVDRAGFTLDVDVATPAFRVVQVTPRGSACSVTLMENKANAGSVQGLHLVVRDIEAARAELLDRGMDVGGFFHHSPTGEQLPGPHPDRVKFGTYLRFSDPDGNGWLVQEVPA